MFLEHVNLSVADVDRSITFYTKLLGLRLRWRGTIGEGRPAAHVGDARCYIAFFQSDNAAPAECNYPDVGLNHFGFVVEDLKEMKKRLAALGITPVAESDYVPGRRIHFFDPDGIEVELVEYGPEDGAPA